MFVTTPDLQDDYPLKDWLTDVRDNMSDSPPRFSLVMNKVDRAASLSQVVRPEERLARLAEELEIAGWHCVSALTGQGVEQAFHRVILHAAEIKRTDAEKQILHNNM